MYADQRYMPRSPRSISLGGALLVNGLVLAGLLTFVPDIVRERTVDPIDTYDVKTPPPPEVVPLKKPELLPEAQQPLPYIPPTVIQPPDRVTITGTDVQPTEPPPTGIVENPGSSTVIDKPLPMPPLLGAQQDPRYSRDFQPEYPAQELRAQRDGTVSIRVLIGTDGRVKAVEQVRATSSAFFEATRRQALAKWRFKPATRGGVPEESWKTMSVRFELTNA